MSKKNPGEGEKDKIVGARIRALRAMYGITAAVLGARIGLTGEQIGRYENGIQRITAGRLWSLAEAMNVPVKFFFSPASISASPQEENPEPGEALVIAKAYLRARPEIRQQVAEILGLERPSHQA
jgi:transcriptional regulator with XRE-family HTH domain